MECCGVVECNSARDKILFLRVFRGKCNAIEEREGLVRVIQEIKLNESHTHEPLQDFL